MPPLLVLPLPEVPLVPEVPELDLPLVPEDPRPQRPELLQGGEQHSSSVVHDEPVLTQATAGVPPSAPPWSDAVTTAHRPERQKLPCPQSVSTVQAASFLLQATTARIAASKATGAAKRAVTREA